MNAIGMMVIGSAVRCTIFAALGLALYAAARRRGPSAGSWVSLTTLLGLVVLSGLALSPWPRWWAVGPIEAARADGPTSIAVALGEPTSGTEPIVSPDPGGAVADAPIARKSPDEPIDGAGPRPEAWIATFARELGRELREPAVATGDVRWRWPARVALVFLAGMTIGLVRLLLGMAAVHAVRRRARPMGDPALLEALDLLRAEMSCTRRVEVRESSEISTPATIGWRRPAVLLPVGWQGWDDRERRVVLAHELAHICRGDYLSGLGAQFSLALHFYHPAAHWLAGQLRLQQELAADAWGARLLGGDRLYLTTLAEMALRQDERPARWPARPFLPTRGTFLRRIEMLRDANHVRHAPMSKGARALTIGVLALTVLLVAGLRGPEITPMARAQVQAAPPLAADSAPKEGFDLTYVPAETTFLVAVRPAELLKRPDLKALIVALEKDGRIMGSSTMPPVAEIDQFLLIGLWRGTGPPRRLTDPRRTRGPVDALILRTFEPRDWKSATADVVADPVGARYKGRVYYRSLKRPDGPCYFAIDDRTVAIASEMELRTVISAATRPAAHRVWFEAWKRVKPRTLAMAVESSWVSDQLGPAAEEASLRPFSPLWDQADAYAMNVDTTEGLALDAVAICNSDDGAQQVAATVEASLTLARNSVRGLRREDTADPKTPAGALAELVNVAVNPLLKGASVERDGTTVRLRSATDINPADLVKLLLSPAVLASRSAARRAQSVNNMKQIGLAMHNYYATHDHFPPAVGYGPDGKTPHSWRVAILPYLEQGELYKQYRFNEPWDSPSNRKVLEKMPDVYHVPGAGGDPTHPSYFVLTGPDTLFADTKGTQGSRVRNRAGGMTGVAGIGPEGKPAIPSADRKGTQIGQVIDGTSNTIMVVEAKRAIPWTKPEDIPFDEALKPSQLGGYFPGGFNAAFADGSVRFLKFTINDSVLRALITKDGGEVISADSY